MKTTYLVILLVVATIAGVAGFASYSLNQPGIYDEFAACLEEQGAVFYGAFWCPHCSDQKAMFGRSVKYLPYEECSNADRSMTETCQAEGIESYPTWKFANGDVITGTQSLEVLAEQTGCVLPGNEGSEESEESLEIKESTENEQAIETEEVNI